MLQARVCLLRKPGVRPTHSIKGKRRPPRFIRSFSWRAEKTNIGTLERKIIEQYRRELSAVCTRLGDREWAQVLAELGPECPHSIRDVAVLHSLAYAFRVAQQYAGSGGVSLADFIQEANLGLFDAAETFFLARTKEDRTVGNKFVTWADSWIRANIFSTIARFRTPFSSRVDSQAYRVRRFVKLFEQEFQRAPYVDEIAQGLHLLKKRVLLAEERRRMYGDYSLDRTTDSKGERLQERWGAHIPDTFGFAPDTLALADSELTMAKKRLARVFASRFWRKLTRRDRRIILLRYGLDGAPEPLALEAIGKKFGLTGARVQQITHRFWAGLHWVPGDTVREREAWFWRELERAQVLAECLGGEIQWNALRPQIH